VAKPSISIPDDGPPLRPHRPLLTLFLVALLFAPLIYEGGLICTAKWVAFFGRWIVVKTPVLDAITGLAQSAIASIDSSFHQVPWRPEAVAIVGLACFLGCGHLLRRK
jgi:hypothetical protein